MLSDTQQFIFNNYLKGSNIFITGPGGCGKTFLIKYIVKHARQNNKKVSVCAMTGCAAYLLNCGATTLHKWTQLGLANRSFNDNIRFIYNNLNRRTSWAATKLLIIDEVSMMSKYMFDLIDAIGKKVHNNNKPFGGIQIILSGDFYQLPPIQSHIDISTKDFCFQSDNWNKSFDYQIHLKKVFRQDNDTFIKILQQIRKGKISTKSIDILEKRIKYIEDKNIQPIILTPLKNTATNINNLNLSKLKTEKYHYNYSIINNCKYKMIQKHIDSKIKHILNSRNITSNLIIKVGSQVMCTVNINVEQGIINGSVGIIKEIRNNYPVIEFNNGVIYHMTNHIWMNEDNTIGISQLPLQLAWAVTIHKSQGSTLEYAQMDLGSDIFSDGQIYVALSRVKSLDNLYLIDFDYKKISANKLVKQYYKSPLILNMD
jgi:ATP-dependent DNA helicase PIF1